MKGEPAGLKALELEDTMTGERSDAGGHRHVHLHRLHTEYRTHARSTSSTIATGYIITDDRMMTSVPGLFAAGDLRVQLTRQVTTAVGDATTAAIAVEKYLAEQRARQAAAVPELFRRQLVNGQFAQNCYLLARSGGRARRSWSIPARIPTCSRPSSPAAIGG